MTIVVVFPPPPFVVVVVEVVVVEVVVVVVVVDVAYLRQCIVSLIKFPLSTQLQKVGHFLASSLKSHLKESSINFLLVLIFSLLLSARVEI